MPSAKGLFHKAVPLSGSSLGGSSREGSERLGSYILKEAGLSVSQIDRLQEMPWRDYYALASRASAKMREETGTRAGFSPVADGVYLPQEPFYTGELSSDIPMIICTTFNETSPSRFDSTLEDITLDGVKEELQGRFGDRTGEIVDAYSNAFPEMKPVEIWSMVISNRQRAIAVADAKSKQAAPVYLAWFGWDTPMFDGRLRAFHTMDIAFWFYNTDVQISHTGGGARPRNLAAKMSDTLVQFMKTGDPNGGGLPDWPMYTSENGETMILDDESQVQNDPDREARASL
jgi:para-nitrobenzyl esterase